MGLKLTGRQKAAVVCGHKSEITLEIAGLSRSVCESCGRVSVSYVKDAYPSEWTELPEDDGSDDSAGEA